MSMSSFYQGRRYRDQNRHFNIKVYEDGLTFGHIMNCILQHICGGLIFSPISCLLIKAISRQTLLSKNVYLVLSYHIVTEVTL